MIVLFSRDGAGHRQDEGAPRGARRRRPRRGRPGGRGRRRARRGRADRRVERDVGGRVAGVAPWPAGPMRGRAVCALANVARSSGPKALMAAAPARPSRTPRRPPRSLDECLAAHLPDDEPLRPAERLQRAELADTLGDRREREQAGDQEGDSSATTARAVPSLREVLRVHERAGHAVGEVLRRRRTPRRRCRGCVGRARRSGALRAHVNGVDAALAVGERLQLGERT